MSETGPAQQLFNVGNRTGAAAFCIGIQAGALDTAFTPRTSRSRDERVTA